MNNTLKRLLSLFMAVAMVMTFAVVPVSAEGDGGEHLHVYAEGVCECGAAEPAGEPAETTTEETEAPTEETEAPTEETEAPTEETEAPTEETEAPTEETEAPTEETEAPTEETEAVCDGTENCAALTHETTCECYDWCAALGCTWEVHHTDCPWGPCTLTEGCELVKGHPGECTGMDTFEMTGQGTADAPYLIDDLATFKWFRDQVNSGNNYAGKHVKLTTGINLNNEEWTPIGNSTNPFNGYFDGGNHTISNLKISGNKNEVGLFGHTNNGEIKNLTVNNAEVSGYLNVGVVAGTPYTSKYTNITVSGMIKVDGMSYVGGVLGKNAYANLTNITVNASSGSYVNANSVENGKAYRTYVGGVVGFIGEGGHVLSNIHSNINVIGSTCDVGGIAGIAHYGNTFTNCSSSGNVTVNASDAGDAVEAGGIAGVWHNGGSQVTFNNCTYTGTLSAPNAGSVTFPNGGLVGQAYNANNTTSGKLMLNGSQEWPAPSVRIDNVGYPSLQAAIDATQTAATIIPQDNIALTETVTIPAGKTITLDLKGHNITNSALAFQVSGTLNLTNSGEAATVSGSDGVKMMENGKLTVGKNVTLTGTDCAIYSSADSVGNFTVTIDGGNVASNSAQFSAVQFNGGNTGVTMNVISGSITAADLGIYFACDGQLNISGGTVTGATGIVAKGGTTTISGDETQITGTGADNAYSENNSGQNSTGDALAVVKNAGYSKPTVSITGGIFTSAYGEAVASYGTDALTGFISRGNFSSNVGPYLVAGKTWDESTHDVVDLKVEEATPSVSVGENVADNVSEAVKAEILGSTGNSPVINVEIPEDLSEKIDTTKAVEDALKKVQSGTDTESAKPDAYVSGVEVTYDYKITKIAEEEQEVTVTMDVTPMVITTITYSTDDGNKTESTEIKTPAEVKENTEYTFEIRVYNVKDGTTHAHVVHHPDDNSKREEWRPEIYKKDDGMYYATVKTKNFSPFSSRALNPDNIVCKINNTPYESLEEAINAAPANANTATTISLVKSIEVAASIEIPTGKNITVDTGNCTLSTAISCKHIFDVSGTLSLKGTFNGNTDIVKMLNNGTLNIESGTFKATECVAYASRNTNGFTINVNGGLLKNTTAEHAVIQTNGTNSTGNINVNGGTIESQDIGIYFPSQGKLTISDGSIQGKTGVYLKSGDLEIKGGTIIGTGAKASCTLDGSGAAATGDAVVIENVGGDTGYESVGTVSITGGTFQSTNASPIGSYASTNPVAEPKEAFVSGGTFSGKEALDASVIVESKRLPADTTGTYSLEEKPGNAESGYYENLDDALSKNQNKNDVVIDVNCDDKVTDSYVMNGSLTLNVGAHKITGDGSVTANSTIKLNAIGNGHVRAELGAGDKVTFTPNGDMILTPYFEEGKGYGTVKVAVPATTGENVYTYYMENGGTITIGTNGSITPNDKKYLDEINDTNGIPVYSANAMQGSDPYDWIHHKNKEGDMQIICNGFYGAVNSIWISGGIYGSQEKVLVVFEEGAEKAGFKVEDGGTIVTLPKNYLNALPDGTYTMNFLYKDGGTATRNFMVTTDYNYSADPTNPKTGDTILLPMAVMFTSAAALFVLLMNRKKRV